MSTCVHVHTVHWGHGSHGRVLYLSSLAIRLTVLHTRHPHTPVLSPTPRHATDRQRCAGTDVYMYVALAGRRGPRGVCSSADIGCRVEVMWGVALVNSFTAISLLSVCPPDPCGARPRRFRCCTACPFFVVPRHGLGHWVGQWAIRAFYSYNMRACCSLPASRITCSSFQCRLKRSIACSTKPIPSDLAGPWYSRWHRRRRRRHRRRWHRHHRRHRRRRWHRHHRRHRRRHLHCGWACAQRHARLRRVSQSGVRLQAARSLSCRSVPKCTHGTRPTSALTVIGCSLPMANTLTARHCGGGSTSTARAICRTRARVGT